MHNAHIPQHVKHQQQPAQYITTRTSKVQRMHVHQLPQMWTHGHSSFSTDVIVCRAQCTHTTTCQTPTTATGTTHRNAYSQGSAFACSPASPDVDPWPQLLHHRSCYLVAQAYIPQQVKHQQQPPAQYIATRTSKVQSMNAHQRVENLTRSRRFDVLHHFTNENITQQGQGSHTCVIDTPQKGCHAQTCFHAFNDDAPTSSRRNKAAAKGASWSC